MKIFSFLNRTENQNNKSNYKNESSDSEWPAATLYNRNYNINSQDESKSQSESDRQVSKYFIDYNLQLISSVSL